MSTIRTRDNGVRLTGHAMCRDDEANRFILLKKRSSEQEHKALSIDTPESIHCQ